MRLRMSLALCLAGLLVCSVALAQTCDFMSVGEMMETAAEQGEWETAYTHAQQIVAAKPDDISTLSAEEQYYLGAAHMYLMAQSMDMAKDGLQDEEMAAFATEVSEWVLNPYEDVRTVSHGEQVNLADYLVPGQYVIFDFYSKYCGPCMQIGPHIEAIAKQRDDVVLVKVDINRPDAQGIDWQSPVAQQYSLRSIPHFKIYGPDGALEAEGQEAMKMMQSWATGG
ncbi:MAG: hypothetical protein GF393_03350 [Armatimonadia bacterium]|nr:hypothetical protein [Armatimonadia bacterium]